MTLQATSLAKIIDATICTAILRRVLLGAFITRIEYLRTSWEISLDLPEEHELIAAGIVDRYWGVLLEASEISSQPISPRINAKSPQCWAEDIVVARLLFSAVGYYVSNVEVVEGSTIHLCFDSGSEIFIPGIVDPIDEVWSLAPGNPPGCKRPFGGNIYAQSYFGELSSDPRLAP